MIPVNPVTTVDGDLQGQAIKMSLDHNATAHLMAVLTDLYSDPEAAIIREYSCNARDSHIEAGITRPIEVTTPGGLSTDFVVKDYGIGLSVDEVVEIYSKYGASTKRGTDAQTGMLGLGGKSGLTYAASFTVTAIKNGVKVVILVGKGEDGVGVMEVVDTVTTTECNGVEIRIPCKHGNDIPAKAKEFFRYWPEGTVIVDGRAPAHVEGIEVEPGLLLTNDLRQDTIIMGGVSYPVGTQWDRPFGLNTSGHFLVTAPIGSVNFTPSREELHYTERTKQFIAGIKHDLKARVEAKVNAELTACKDHAEAFTVAQTWKKLLGWNSAAWQFIYKTEAIPVKFGGDFVSVTQRYNGRFSTYATKSIAAEELASHLVILGLQGEKPTPTMRKKAEQYVLDNSLDFDNFLFVRGTGSVDQRWVQTDVVSLADIQSIVLPKNSVVVNGTRVAVKRDPYDKVVKNGGIEETATLSTSSIVYGSPSDFQADGWINYRRPLFNYFDALGFDVVLIGKNRWDKFMRDYPHAIKIDTHIQAQYDNAVAALTPEGKVLWKASERDVEISRYIDKAGMTIDDPTVAEFIRCVTDPVATKAVNSITRIDTGASNIGLSVRSHRARATQHVKSFVTQETRGSNTVYSCYGLCYDGWNNNSGFRSHFGTYINAVFGANTKEIS